jgi:hypothetical protein
MEQVSGAENEEPWSSPGNNTVHLSQPPPEHMDVDVGARKESAAEGQHSGHTGRDTCPHSSGGTTLGSAWTHSRSTGYGFQLFVISMGDGGPGLYREGGWLLL